MPAAVNRFKTGSYHVPVDKIEEANRALIAANVELALGEMMPQHGPVVMTAVILALVPELCDLKIDPELFIHLMNGEVGGFHPPGLSKPRP